jgi:sirohydrochlorin cobaltochelatase
MGIKAMRAIVFFGHGARDLRWREPFDRLLELWVLHYPEIPARLAFLELMTPSLQDCIAALHQEGVLDVKIIPVFFGQGGHLRNDFPVLLQDCQQQFPDMELSSSSAVGQSDEILKAIIEFAIHSNK